MSNEFNPQLKLSLYPEKLVAFKKGDWTEAPVNVEIAPTNHCNAVCPWCFYVNPSPDSPKIKHSRSELDRGVLVRALEDMSWHNVKAISWTGGGDPSLYSAIDDMSLLVRDLGMKQGIFTNAYKPLAHPEVFNWIRITVTEKFIITKHVAEYAKVTKVGVNYNLCKENAEHLEDMCIQARGAGVTYFQVRPALADRWEFQQTVETPVHLKQYETTEFRIVLTPYKFEDHARPHGYNNCYAHVITPFVWFDGNVDVCAYHKRTPGYTFGNLYEQSWREIWCGVKRHKMLEDRVKVIPSCQHCCKPHEANKVLAAISGEYPLVEDKEFV